MHSTLLHNRRLRFLQILTAGLLISITVTAKTHAFPTPSIINTNGQRELLILGDSLSVGTDAFGQLQARVERTDIWPSVVIDDRVGRTAKQSIPLLQKRVSAQTTAIVIALATNDLLSHSEPSYPKQIIDEVMSTTNNLPVLWVNVEYSATGRRDWVSRSARFNKALVTARSRWPQLQIADWNKFFIPKSKSRFIADGIHLTVSGYKTRATFLVDQLQLFGNTIVNSSTTTTTSTTTSTTTTTVAPTDPVG